MQALYETPTSPSYSTHQFCDDPAKCAAAIGTAAKCRACQERERQERERDRQKTESQIKKSLASVQVDKIASSKPFSPPPSYRVDDDHGDAYEGDPAPSPQPPPPPDAPVLDQEQGDDEHPEVYTDTWNSHCLVKAHGADLRYGHQLGKWFVWSETHWAEDRAGEIVGRTKQTLLGTLAQCHKDLDTLRKLLAGDADDETKKKALKAKVRMEKRMTHVVKSLDFRRITAMHTLARPELAILPEDLNKNTWLFNAQNGTIDLRTGELRPHRREDYLTSVAPVSYFPFAKCDLWKTVLDQVFLGKLEIIGYVQRLLGYCLTGDTREHILPIFWGSGANGKSTILNTFMAVLGIEYAIKAPRDLLLVHKGDKHPTTVAQLWGKRFVAAIESGESAKLDEAMVKELTGGDRLTGRFMKKDYFQFEPTHKILLATNHRPEVRGTDHAIWRRLRLIPFTAIFEEGKNQDKRMGEKLLAELPGILAWCVQGCLAWQKDGLGQPAEVMAATAAYRSEQDVFGQWLAERCITGSQEYRQRLSELFADYEKWTEASAERTLSKRKFSGALKERGFSDYTNNGAWFRGLAIRADLEEV